MRRNLARNKARRAFPPPSFIRASVTFVRHCEICLNAAIHEAKGEVRHTRPVHLLGLITKSPKERSVLRSRMRNRAHGAPPPSGSNSLFVIHLSNMAVAFFFLKMSITKLQRYKCQTHIAMLVVSECAKTFSCSTIEFLVFAPCGQTPLARRRLT